MSVSAISGAGGSQFQPPHGISGADAPQSCNIPPFWLQLGTYIQNLSDAAINYMNDPTQANLEAYDSAYAQLQTEIKQLSNQYSDMPWIVGNLQQISSAMSQLTNDLITNPEFVELQNQILQYQQELQNPALKSQWPEIEAALQGCINLQQPYIQAIYNDQVNIGDAYKNLEFSK